MESLPPEKHAALPSRGYLSGFLPEGLSEYDVRFVGNTPEERTMRERACDPVAKASQSAASTSSSALMMLASPFVLTYQAVLHTLIPSNNAVVSHNTVERDLVGSWRGTVTEFGDTPKPYSIDITGISHSEYISNGARRIAVFVMSASHHLGGNSEEVRVKVRDRVVAIDGQTLLCAALSWTYDSIGTPELEGHAYMVEENKSIDPELGKLKTIGAVALKMITTGVEDHSFLGACARRRPGASASDAPLRRPP